MRAMLIFCAALVAGCATCPVTVTQTRVIDTVCDWVPKMTASTNDTVETKREILAYEIARQKNCPPR